MKKVLPILVVMIVAVGGYLGLKTTGAIGESDSGATALTAFADEINNADGGLSLHATVRLDSASIEGTVISIMGTSLSDADASTELKFLASQSEVVKHVCADEALNAAVTAGATLSINFSTVSGEELGTKNLSGEYVCP